MSPFRCPPSLLAAVVCLAPLAAAGAAEKATISSFDSGGVKIVYAVQGKGEPVVLLHGWLSSAGVNWGLPGIADHLARDFQVIAPDSRGHGLSDKPTKEEAYGPELVEDVVRLLDHLKVEKAHIVGYSMGGIVAAKFAAKHPDRARSVTLGGMGWLQDGGLGQLGFALLGKNDPKPDAAGQCFRSLAKLALTEDEVKGIKVPVTVLVGTQDDLVVKLYVEPLRKVRKDWPVVGIKDGNHLTCIVKPQFKDEIAAWLKKNAK